MMKNGVKPRFDNAGTEFGLMHRDLGPGYLMFDIDRMQANLEMSIQMKREDEGFVEYRRRGSVCDFVAMFEVKMHRTRFSEKALDPRQANSFARIEIARRLECRLFVVFGENGRQPFTFHEVDIETEQPSVVGILRYTEADREAAVQRFWRDVLRIER